MPLQIQDYTIRHDLPLPLYYQVKQALYSAITEKRLVPGECIPPETELMERFGVSRATVRQAVGELMHSGYLYRHKGKGTFVSAPKVDEGFFSRLESFNEEISRKGLVPSTRVLSLKAAAPIPYINAQLELAPEERLICLSRLRCADGVPVVFFETYLPYSRYAGLLEQDFVQNSLYSLLETQYGHRVNRARRTIEAVLSSPQEAKLLELKSGAPVFLVKTLAMYNDTIPAEYSVARYSGENNRFTVEVSR